MSGSAGILSRRGALAALGGGAAACVAGQSVASTDATFRRGVNLSHWLAQSYEGTTPAHYAHFVNLARLDQLATLGFDHGRLCVDPMLLFAQEGDPALDRLQLGYLHAALDKIHAANLSAIVDVHPVGAAKDVLLTPQGAERFVASWRLLSADLARQARKPVLEILNEPTPLAGDAWWSLQGRALSAIRQGDPRSRIIANGGTWSGVDDLVSRTPYDVQDVTYTFHYYAPMLFTHQATTWSWEVAERVAQLSWPLSAAEAPAAAAAATHDDIARRFVREAVAAGDFTKAAMTANLERLKAWQASHGDPPIYVGEFGVYAKQAPREARLAWLNTARSIFEANGWGWAVWDMSSDFGFESKESGHQTIDMAMMSALGLGV